MLHVTTCYMLQHRGSSKTCSLKEAEDYVLHDFIYILKTYDRQSHRDRKYISGFLGKGKVWGATFNEQVFVGGRYIFLNLDCGHLLQNSVNILTSLNCILYPLKFLFFKILLASWILVPPPGIEPMPPGVEARKLNHWTTSKVHLFLKSQPLSLFNKNIYYIYLAVPGLSCSVQDLQSLL